jgi:Zn-dependent protease with chaperone function
MQNSMTQCMGVPVRFDEDLPYISDSRGLWRWKEIVVGPSYFALTAREKQAVLAHEAGHCKLLHLEKRILRLWLLVMPKRLLAYCHQQEYQADQFAKACGYGAAMISLLERVALVQSEGGAAQTQLVGSLYHPPLQSRIERLKGA